MSQQFFTVLTNAGSAALANSAALGQALELTEFAVGDGGGAAFDPDVETLKKTLTLTKEVYRGAINELKVDPNNPARYYIEGIVPIAVGGWTVRETGWFLADGTLFAVTKYPPSYKSIPADGVAVELPVRTYLATGATENVELKIDPTVVLATREYVDSTRDALQGDVDNKFDKTGGDVFGHTNLAADAGVVSQRKILATKVFDPVYFINGEIDQAIDIELGTDKLWGALSIEITSAYSFQNSSGLLKKTFGLGLNPGPSFHTNSSIVEAALGHIALNFVIGDVYWNAEKNSYCIPISHSVKTGNAIYVTARLLSASTSSDFNATTLMKRFKLSGFYTLEALPRQYSLTEKLAVTESGVDLGGALTQKGVPVPTRKTYQNPGTMTLKGSLDGGANITELNRWGNGAVTFTAYEFTFAIGDNIVIDRFYAETGVISIVTDSGIIITPKNTNAGSTITMSDAPFMVTLTKMNPGVWKMRVTPTGKG